MFPKMHSFASLLVGTVFAAIATPVAYCGAIQKIWLTHAEELPSSVVVNWETTEAGDSVVLYGATTDFHKQAIGEAKGTLHHVQIPLPESGALYYRVQSGGDVSAIYQIREAPTDELRVVVIGDAGYALKPWGKAVLAEKPHLLITAGDNVPSLHNAKRPANVDDTSAFSRLISAYPDLFRSTPMLPALGNHDREVRPRGSKPPAEAVYDPDAIAFRSFFALPGEEWIWSFTLPKFGVRFAALDLSHLSDFGTTWQTCHPFQRDSKQYAWFRDLVTASRDPYFVTIYNEQNSRVRSLEDGEWGRMIRKGSMAITGFGYFAERAEVDGFNFYNTCLDGTGTRYPDPKSQFIENTDNYLLMTFRPGSPAQIDIKSLDGRLLERRSVEPRL